jgi:hypothetical protein
MNKKWKNKKKSLGVGTKILGKLWSMLEQFWRLKLKIQVFRLEE